jgi:hypothetical protein
MIKSRMRLSGRVVRREMTDVEIKDEVDGRVARMGETINTYKFLVGKLEGKRPIGVLGVDGRTKLKWIFKKQGATIRTGLV